MFRDRAAKTPLRRFSGKNSIDGLERLRLEIVLIVLEQISDHQPAVSARSGP